MLNNIVALLGNGGGVANSYESIATVTVGAGGSSSVSFSSIPSTYKHLQIRLIARNTATGSGTETFIVRFNSDSGSNYNIHNLYGTGTATGAGGAANTTYLNFYDMPRAGEQANAFAGAIMDVLDYQNTNKYKTARTLSGMDTNANTYGYIGLYSGAWRNTNAVTQIDITASAGNFAQYSSFALYGVKG